MNDQTYLKYLLQIFNIFGICTITFAPKKEKKPIDKDLHLVVSRTAIFYNLLLIPFLITMNYCGMRVAYFTVYKERIGLYSILDYFEMVFGTFISVLLLVSYCLHPDSVIKIISEIFELKKTLNLLSSMNYESNEFLSSILLIIFYLTLAIVLITTSMVSNKWNALIGLDVRNLLISGVLLQYAVVVKSILGMFEKINHYFFNFSTLTVQHQKSTRNFFLLDANKLQLLIKLQDLHHSLIEVSQEVISFYKIKVFGCIMQTLIYLVAFAYFQVDIIIEKKLTFSFVEYFHLCLWSVCYTFSLILLSRYITNTIEEVIILLKFIHIILF